ncbi:class I SAM-dependent methyltransferase [Clostridium cylindrosporum]|uniref:Tellurite methyltransferase TehB n=1 Tax=Clostridium cylindrosporum DSM 605 TaxID=1121307 RepID=A0A0J8D731_CLOCY|nr:methyltransferase domain-containing protein [Clostridium cylindrosporum]KMT21875.1 tellurite methyltransferase TehB [Clostridium cylindrosporum DSM 605]
MESIKKWDDKYRNKGDNLKEPEGFVVDNVDNLLKGSLLDLASGDGRNSIFLAKKGFDVTAADFSIEALKRLERFSKSENASLKTALLDLSLKENLLFLGKFDNILISKYKIDDFLIPTIEGMLNPGGRLIYCTFNMNHHRENGFNKEYCLEENELKNKVSLSLLKYESLESKDNYIDGYIFIK